jgi:hypothetical protein
MTASHVMVSALLLAVADPDSEQRQLLESRETQMVTNVRGLVVGSLSPTTAMKPQL